MKEWWSRLIRLDGDDPERKRAELRNYFLRTQAVYEALFDVLVDDRAFYERPEPLRHPLIFYFGHTAVFFVNKLVAAKVLARIHPQFEGMFAIGVDEMSWDDLDQKHYGWPSVEEVRIYRQKVRDQVLNLIDSTPIALPIRWQDHPLWAILMGIEHERIHLETSSVLIRQLNVDWVCNDSRWPICPESGESPMNGWVPVQGGTVLLGKPRDHCLYGWDNEYGQQVEAVADFETSRYVVSNGEYFEFVSDGGYRNLDWWTEEGQRWLTYTEARHPEFWVATDEGYAYRAMTGVIPMPWNWPVDVNYLEAKAFCNWKSAQTGLPVRLPTEAEYYRLTDWVNIADEPDWPDRDASAPGNINLEYWASSCPVDQFEQGPLYDVIGNVWQWTETSIDGFPGFETHPLYDDFSVPTFDGRHNLIKGGSWISTGNEATHHARYAFRRHFFQHAGFRYVAGPPLNETRESSHAIYETDVLLAQYCEMHYGRTYYGVPNFSQALVDFAIQQMQGRRQESALDIGCAVGRASFELTRYFDRVVGLDYSARFIRIAEALMADGELGYQLPTEGDLTENRWIRLRDLGLETPEGLSFWQQDACNLKPHFTGYDLVLAANLIDRLYDPKKFLREIADRISEGGLLIIASPYTWLEDFTPREKWLGGHFENGRPVTTFDALREQLTGPFQLVGEPVDIPFVIRETARKFQHSLSQVTVWERL